MKKQFFAMIALCQIISFATSAQVTRFGTNSGTTGNQSSFFGYRSGQVNTGAYNTFVGHDAGKKNTTGTYNTFLGTSAGQGNITGKYNLLLGASAGLLNNNTIGYNVMLGASAGILNNGAYNIFIGESAGAAASGSNNVFIGYRTGFSTSGSYKLAIGNGSGTPLISGSFSSKVVGINTSNPRATLEVYKNGGTSTLRLHAGNPNVGSSIDFFNGARGTADEFYMVGIRAKKNAAGTAGQLQFYINGNNLQQNVLNLQQYKVGINHFNPLAELDVYRPTRGTATIRLQGGGSGWNPARMEFWSDPRGSSSEWRPGYISSIDNGGFTGGLAIYTNGSGSNQRTGSVEVMRVVNGKVGIGTTLRGVASEHLDGYKLFVTEGIKTEKIRVQLAASRWADYVFAKNYQLRPLEEVEEFIAQNKHLPDVPSAAEVGKKGIDLGQMDATLLRKVEELTLYIIQLKKQNEQLQQRLEKLENK
ncbi:MAG TPA: hypothetical protein DCS93_04820 [Microscillaceae bacterium]|nr:hypothetical protein [Microscillaceae bacterium]